MRSQTTTENDEKFTSLDTDLLIINQQFSRTPASMNSQSQRETANNPHFWSSSEPEVATDNTWSRLQRQEKAISTTSSFLTSVSGNDRELRTSSQAPLTDANQASTTTALNVFSDTTFGEDSTTMVTAFDERTPIAQTLDVSNTDVWVSENDEERDGKSAVVTKLDPVGGGVDNFTSTKYFINSIGSKSNTRHNDVSQSLTSLTNATRPSTTNRTTPRTGGRKRCLQMRTGGDDIPSMDCHDYEDLSGTTNHRRRLEFCGAYSAYVADFDCAPSSSCLDFICPEVVLLDRLAREMNDQFIDHIMNYDCDNRYSGVWNCSACKVMSLD